MTIRNIPLMISTLRICRFILLKYPKNGRYPEGLIVLKNVVFHDYFGKHNDLIYCKFFEDTLERLNVTTEMQLNEKFHDLNYSLSYPRLIKKGGKHG